MASKSRCTCQGNVFKKCKYPHNGIQTNSSKKRRQKKEEQHE